MTFNPQMLDTAGIIGCCARGFVPVGAPPHAAIAAHRSNPGPLTLHAIVTADTRNPDNCRAMIDYLLTLPVEAWRHPGSQFAAERRRESVLDMLRRDIAWSETCA